MAFQKMFFHKLVLTCLIYGACATELSFTLPESGLCLNPCKEFFAGSSADDVFVCQAALSGAGLFSERQTEGVSCFPAYNCLHDWIKCRPRDNAELNEDGSDYATGSEPDAKPSDEDICADIANLEQGGASGQDPPSGGWVPSLYAGWLKGTGDLGCGWGAGKEGIIIQGDDLTNAAISDAYTCCLAAMAYDDVSLSEDRMTDGAAVRFAYQEVNEYGQADPVCRIDFESLLNQNLDSSSGLAHDRLDLCGDNEYYWRHAVGAAEGANLALGGKCALDWQRNDREELTAPLGYLGWHGGELPNHACGSGSDCEEGIRHNDIPWPEACCDACATLLGVEDSETNEQMTANPCVAWQITDGKCQIRRQAYFDANYNGQSITAAINDLTDEAPCLDNDDCQYTSDLFFMEVHPDLLNEEIQEANRTANYRLLESMDSFDWTSIEGENFTIVTEVTHVADRSDTADEENCAEISLYLADELGGYDVAFFNEVNDIPKALCVSACVSTDAVVTVTCNNSLIQFALDSVSSSNGGSRRLFTDAGTLTLSMAAKGTGANSVDFSNMHLGSEDEATYASEDVVEVDVEMWDGASVTSNGGDDDGIEDDAFTGTGATLQLSVSLLLFASLAIVLG